MSDVRFNRGGVGYSIFRLTKILFKISVISFWHTGRHFELTRLGTTNVAAVEVRGGTADYARVHFI
jgi:hypothetical protein